MTPPLLFREVWQQPPHTGPLNDENRRITPQALTNADLELRLYGTDARNIQVTEHNGVPDLWTGFTTSPVALTLRHKGAYLDLTGLTRMRWRTRTENLHVLHPVVKLADGTLLVGSQTFSSPQRPMVGSNAYSGNFVVSEVTFDDQRWFQLDPVKVVTLKEVGEPGPEPRGRDRFRRSHARRRTRVCRVLERLMDRGVRDSAQALRSPLGRIPAAGTASSVDASS